MSQTRLRFAGFAAALIGCSGALACNSLELDGTTPPAAEAVAARDEAVVSAPPLTAEERAAIDRDRGRARCHEGTGDSELSIRWEKSDAGAQDHLLATVHNHSTVALTAEPVLLAANPLLGEVRERRLAAVQVAPGADLVVPVAMSELPLQTVGQATAVSVGLRWRRGDQEMVSPLALSEDLYVTHEEGFKSAVIREAHEERTRQLATVSRLGSQRIAAVRSLDQLGVARTTNAAQLATQGGLVVAEAPNAQSIDGRQP